MPPAALSAVLLAVPLASSLLLVPPGAGEQAGEAAVDDLAYLTCPGVGPVSFGVVPVVVACTNGPVQAGNVIAHGFGFPPPGFSGRITSRLVGDAGAERTFTCSSSYALNAPVAGLVSPMIACGGAGAFPFGQGVTQVCVVEGIVPLGGGGQGVASAGAWSCYLGT